MMKYSNQLPVACCLIGVLILITCLAQANIAADPLDIQFPGHWAEELLKNDFREPSGICFHKMRGTLFVVGDEGDLGEVKTNGDVIRITHIRAADFEGVTHDPASGLLYVAIEGDEIILEIDPDTFRVEREFVLPRGIGNKVLLAPEGQGIEGITFVPEAGHREGGWFLVANQTFSLETNNDISAVFRFDLPLRSKQGQAKLVDYFPIQTIDLAGLFYDSDTNHIFVISDAMNMIFECTKTFEIVSAYTLPGENQEGITRDNDGFVYIAQDSGRVLKWKRYLDVK